MKNLAFIRYFIHCILFQYFMFLASTCAFQLTINHKAYRSNIKGIRNVRSTVVSYSTQQEPIFNISKYLLDNFSHNHNPLDVKLSLLNSSIHNSLSDMIFLVDLSVRKLSDVVLPEVTSTTAWQNFIAKLTSIKSDDMSLDKFLYTQDIGSTYNQKISMARIPTEMYAKLDLARRLAEAHSSSTTPISIFLLTAEDGLYYEKGMFDAIISGFQMQSFVMPTMKSGGSNRGNKDTRKEKAGEEDEVTTLKVNKELIIYSNPEEIEDDNNKLEEAEEQKQPTAAAGGSGGGGGLASLSKEEMAERMNQGWDIYYSGGSNNGNMKQAKEHTASNADENQQLGSSSGNKRLSLTLQREVDCILAINQGTNLCRALTSLPPNILHPASFCALIQQLSSTSAWKYKEYNPIELQDMGCGAFSAVIAGNQPPSSGSSDANCSADRLVHLTWDGINHKKTTEEKLDSFFSKSNAILKYRSDADTSLLTMNENKPIVLVGKGVCYDTGGLALKPRKDMRTMKHDMGGAAAALGLFYTLTSLDIAVKLECWLAIAENNIGPLAYRPDDVIRSVTGMTIEIMDTDAEGRLLLADTLALASRKASVNKEENKQGGKASSSNIFKKDDSPSLLLDFATLTGSSVAALTNRYIGTISNRPEFLSPIIEAGKSSGERLWPYPCDDDFEDDLASEVADILQCRLEGEGDHIYAATLLKKFIKPSVPWIHFDISSAHRPGGLGHVASEYTGSGVRSAGRLIRLLCNLPKQL